MSSQSRARDLLTSINSSTKKPGARPSSQDRPARIGTVDAAYTAGLPRVLIDGETTMGAKGYAWLQPYTPLPGDRVVLLPIGRGYVIAGRVVAALGGSGLAPFRQASGVGVNNSSQAAGALANVAVVFPVGRFTLPPDVVVSTNNARLVAAVNSLTAAGFSLQLFNAATTTVATSSFWWQAVQALPGSAEG